MLATDAIRRLALSGLLLVGIAASTLGAEPVATGAPLGELRVEPFGTGLPQRGQWRHGFDIADMNGDGFADLLHGPPRKGDGRPVVFLGDGRGGFAPWAEA